MGRARQRLVPDGKGDRVLVPILVLLGDVVLVWALVWVRLFLDRLRSVALVVALRAWVARPRLPHPERACRRERWVAQPSEAKVRPGPVPLQPL